MLIEIVAIFIDYVKSLPVSARYNNVSLGI